MQTIKFTKYLYKIVNSAFTALTSLKLLNGFWQNLQVSQPPLPSTIYVILTDPSTKMTDLLYDWLSHFWRLLCNYMYWTFFTKLNRKQVLESTINLLYIFYFLWRSVDKYGRFDTSGWFSQQSLNGLWRNLTGNKNSAVTYWLLVFQKRCVSR